MFAAIRKLIKGQNNQVAKEEKQNEVANFFDKSQGVAIKDNLVEGIRLAYVRPLSIEEVTSWTEPFSFRHELPNGISGLNYKSYNFFTVINGAFQVMSFEICTDMSNNDIMSMLNQKNTKYFQHKPLYFVSASVNSQDCPFSGSPDVVVFEQVPIEKSKKIIAEAKKKPKKTLNSNAKTNQLFPDYLLLGGVLFRTKYMSAYWALPKCLQYILFEYSPTAFCTINGRPAVHGLGYDAIIDAKNISIIIDEFGMAEIQMRVESDEEFELYASEARLIEEICFQLELPLPKIKEKK